MKKLSIICVCFIASMFAGRLNAQESFSGSERFLKINEPYVAVSLLGNNDKTGGLDLPTWGLGLGRQTHLPAQGERIVLRPRCIGGVRNVERKRLGRLLFDLW